MKLSQAQIDVLKLLESGPKHPTMLVGERGAGWRTLDWLTLHGLVEVYTHEWRVSAGPGVKKAHRRKQMVRLTDAGAAEAAAYSWVPRKGYRRA